MKANRKSSENEEAVSPVIGVILMVAITVILATIIAPFVFSIGGSLKKSYLVAATASQSGPNTIDFTYHGGPDHNMVQGLNYSVGNGTRTAVPSPSPGTTWFNTGNASTGKDHVVVSAYFSDGSEQVILDTSV